MKIGDRVVCIDDSNTGYEKPLIKGREYIIYNIKKCNVCGIVNYDIGHISSLDVDCSCFNVISNAGCGWFFKSTRFRKVEEKKEVNYVKLEIKIEEPCLN